MGMDEKVVRIVIGGCLVLVGLVIIFTKIGMV